KLFFRRLCLVAVEGDGAVGEVFEECLLPADDERTRGEALLAADDVVERTVLREGGHQGQHDRCCRQQSTPPCPIVGRREEAIHVITVRRFRRCPLQACATNSGGWRGRRRSRTSCR